MTAKHLTRTKAGKALLSLVVLAMLAVTLQSLVFSGATFTARSSNASNVFSAATLTHTNSKAGQVVVDATGLHPGETRSSQLTLTGGGDVTGVYTLTAANIVDTPVSPGLSNTLILTVNDVTGGTPGAQLYHDTVARLNAVTPSLGPIAPGAYREYQIVLDYPSNAPPALVGAAMDLTLRFTGVSP